MEFSKWIPDVDILQRININSNTLK
jgi:hypothetical protein